MNENTAERPWEKRTTDPNIRETAERIREEWLRDQVLYLSAKVGAKLRDAERKMGMAR